MKPVTCSGSMGIFSYTVDPHAEFSLKQHKENMYINNEYIKETKKKETVCGSVSYFISHHYVSFFIGSSDRKISNSMTITDLKFSH
jgi:hypothetical protein